MKMVKSLSFAIVATLFVLHGGVHADFSITSTEDTYTQQDDSAANFNAEDIFEFGAPAGSQARSMLMRFGGAELAAAAALTNAEIFGVRLELDLLSNTGSREGFFGMLNAANQDWGNATATWDTKDGATAWAGAAGARDVTNDTFGSFGTIDLTLGQTSGIITLNLDPVAGGFADFEAMFDELTDGTNNGFVIYNTGGPHNGTQTFTSLEGSTNVGGFAPRLVVLTAPVPEPSSLALLGLGAFGLVARRRRR